MPRFLLMFFDNSLTFSGLLPAHLFLVSKASIASNSFPIEHVQPLTPSTFTKVFFLNIFHHNITTRNSKLSNFQMPPPTLFLILHSHTSQWIFISLIYTVYFCLKQLELTIKRPHSIIPRIFWCQRPVTRHVSMRRVRPWWMSSVGATKTRHEPWRIHHDMRCPGM